MKKTIAFLFRWFSGDLSEDVIRYLIERFLPGYHLHQNPAKRVKGEP